LPHGKGVLLWERETGGQKSGTGGGKRQTRPPCSQKGLWRADDKKKGGGAILEEKIPAPGVRTAEGAEKKKTSGQERGGEKKKEALAQWRKNGCESRLV